MKKLFCFSLVVLVALAMTSCGSSRKTGCPAVAKLENTHYLRA